VTNPATSPDAIARALHEAVARSEGRVLGRGYQATVELYSTPAGDAVVKRAHGKGPFGPLYRYLLRREHAVYERLAGVPGVPRTYGLIDGEHLALEYIPGPSLRTHEHELKDRAGFFAALLETLRAMHAAGVAHADLKRKANIIVGPGERPWLIDFGIAAQRGESALGRSWFEHQVQADYNAWIKLKYGRRIEPAEAARVLSAGDAALYRPLWTERVARAIRVPWQTITLRRPRQRWRAERERTDSDRR
jgi:predicted Ser/Thr protein kinase